LRTGGRSVRQPGPCESDSQPRGIQPLCHPGGAPRAELPDRPGLHQRADLRRVRIRPHGDVEPGRPGDGAEPVLLPRPESTVCIQLYARARHGPQRPQRLRGRVQRHVDVAGQSDRGEHRSAPSAPNSPYPELSDMAIRHRDGSYSSVEARQALIERGTTLAVNESVRVWLVATETFAYSDRISNVAYDLDGGLWSPFAVRTARFASPGGTLQVGQRLQFLSAWQPWQGFSSIYDLVVGNTFMDSGVAIHPHTGQYIPVRAAFDTTTAGPAGSLSVPTDAILYNASTGACESVAPGTTSH